MVPFWAKRLRTPVVSWMLMPEAVGLRAAVVERFSEVADVADCLASASGERVGDLRSLAAGQVEHRQCVSHVFRGVAHGHAVRGGEVEGPCQAAGEYGR